MNKIFRYTLLSLALSIIPTLMWGQQQWNQPRLPSTATGHIYLIPFPEPLKNLQDARFPSRSPESITLMIYSDAPTTVWISNLGNGSGTTAYTLPGKEMSEIALPMNGWHFVERNSNPSNNVFRVLSLRPIYVTCHMTTNFGSEGWVPLPVEAWGKEYYAATLPSEIAKDGIPIGENNFGQRPVGAPSQIIITAAFNNTEVTVTPNADVVNGSAGTPFTISLDAGEAYTVVSTTDTTSTFGGDLAGTKIISNKLIGVTTGNTRAAVIDQPIGLLKNSVKNMMVESLSPVEQHGTEFVFLPALDEVRMLNSGPSDSHREAEFARIFGTSAGRTNGLVVDSTGGGNTFRLQNGGTYTKEFNVSEARMFRTDQPSQGMLYPASFMKFNGTTGTGQFIGASYHSWSSYMLEMTPREQWTSQAVCKASTFPNGMRHYLNVVADANDQYDIYYRSANGSRQLFPFNRGMIAGTSLVWGQITINPGLTYRIEGENGATFAGSFYGQLSGFELYRPGSPMLDDKGSSTSSLHPSEYEEDLAKAYGYPLTPLRRWLGRPSFFDIIDEEPGTDEKGRIFRVSIRQETPEGVDSELPGLRSISLHPESVNAEFELLDPTDPLDLIGKTEAVVRVYPVDPSKNAEALLLVTDRTGGEESVEFEHVGITSSVENVSSIQYRFDQIEPNPIRTNGRFTFTLGEGGNTRVEITNALGQSVALLFSGEMKTGYHSLDWDATGLPAGTYFCTIQSGWWKETARVVVQ
ncbi:MAG: T9SS type A sorting domain-containing protein [Candidatus Kapaibacterium sp.]